MSFVFESFSAGASEGELHILTNGVWVAVIQRWVSAFVRICCWGRKRELGDDEIGKGYMNVIRDDGEGMDMRRMLKENARGVYI